MRDHRLALEFRSIGRAIVIAVLLFGVGGVGGTEAGGGVHVNGGALAPGVNSVVWEAPGGAPQSPDAVALAIAEQAPDLEVVALWMLRDRGWQYYLAAAPAHSTMMNVPSPAGLFAVLLPPGWQAAATPAAPLESPLAEQLNSERASRGVPSPSSSAVLTAVAEDYAQLLLSIGYPDTGSQNPHGQDGTPSERAQRYGYPTDQVGEVLAWASGMQGSADEQAAMLVAGWLDSSIHRSIVLDPDFTEMGVGCAGASPGRVICVVDFGRR